MTDTLVGTPDPAWWKQVFTPEEYDKLNGQMESIVNEYQVPAEELVELIVNIPADEIVPALRALGPTYGDGHPLVDRLIEGLADVYYTNILVPVDEECTRIWDRITQEPEDEDDWFS